MKLYYTVSSIITIMFMSFFTQAQNIKTGKQADAIFSGTELIRTSKYSSAPSYIKYRTEKQPLTSNYLQNLDKYLKLGESLHLKLESVEEDELGFIHYRYYETYKGIPLEYTAWYIHSKQGKVVSSNGLIHRSLPNVKQVGISPAQSIQYAKNHVGATTYKWELPGEEAHLKIEQNDNEATYFPKPTLVYVPNNNDFSSDGYTIAYKLNIYAQQPLSRQIVFVNAVNGEILNTIEQIHETDVTGSAITGYSGNQSIVADQVSMNNFRLRESGRGNGIETYNMQQGTSYGSSVDFTDSDNNWNNVNAQFDQYATDAHWGAEMTYDYLLTEHGRNSIDNAGFKLISYVHFDQGYNNAFWDGSRMTYGDGNGNPLTSIDIAGHEIAHGLTSNTANLVYNAESGALNESFSDIFGAAVERFGRPSNWNWTMGEDLGSPFRSMSNPNSMGDPDTYFGVNWASLTGGDNGGVHTNSSVQNYWFYLLSDGGSGTNDNGDTYSLTGMGFNKAEDVAFRNLTVYLNQSSNFSDARFYSIQAAIDLYGACTPEVGQVTDAWYAVGIGSSYVPYTVAEFEAPTLNSCSAPFTVAFNNMSVNANSYNWSFGDGATSTQINPTHTYTSFGSYTVTLNANGGICGIADTIRANYIVISDTLPCIVSLPPSGAAQTQNSCTGYLYDSGGPTGNYGANEQSQITIAPTGASYIDLIIHSFSIEAGQSGSCNFDDLRIYDGPNTNSTLIGVYCNNNPLTNIQSTGGALTIVFSSDQGLEESGFEIEWICTSPNAPPVASFNSDNESSCSGDISFTDYSNNAPTSWLWNFGDGQTSTQQNPTHHYNSSGLFTVTLTATNGFGQGSNVQTDLINISFETPPTTINDTTCPGLSDTLIAISNANHNWYDNQYLNGVIFTGDTFVTPPLNTSTTFYVEKSTIATTDTVGPADNNIGGGNYFSGNQSLIFDVLAPINLNSVYVYSQSNGDRTIRVEDAAGNLIETKTVTLTNGPQRVYLGFNIPVGTGYKITIPSGLIDLYRNNSGVSYPYTITNLVSITNSTAGPEYYYFFYDWHVQSTTCTSARVPVIAVIDVCSGIEDLTDNWEVVVFPNPASNVFSITIKNNSDVLNTKMSIINSVGQLIKSQSLVNENTRIDISNIAPGLYYIQIKSGDHIHIEKLIVN